METSAIKERVWDLLEVTEHPDTGAVKWDWVDVSLLVLILMSVVVVVLETVQPLYHRYSHLFITFDVVTVVVRSPHCRMRLGKRRTTI